MYLVLSIIQGGAGYPFMSRCMFAHIATESHNVKSIPASMVPDAMLQFVVEKVCPCMVTISVLRSQCKQGPAPRSMSSFRGTLCSDFQPNTSASIV